MSAIVFAGSAQFSAVAILAQGGGAGAAIAAAALMNSRFLPMGVALAPSFRGGPFSARSRARPWSTPPGRSPRAATAASTQRCCSAPPRPRT